MSLQKCVENLPSAHTQGSRNVTVTYPTSVPRVAPERATNSNASAALAFSMLGAVVLSVILAIAALCEVKNPAGWSILLFALARAQVI